MKRALALTALLAFTLFAFSACASTDTDDQAPEFFSEIGKTLSELKSEHPDGKYAARLDGFPDCAAACLEDADAEYAYYFFGLQSGDMEKALNECADTLQCAGFATTAGVLFPAMAEEMPFKDFFALIGVEDYEYLVGEDVITGEGWLRFSYHGMEVMINTNEANANGGWRFTGTEIVRRDAPASVRDTERAASNEAIADAFLFN